MQLEEGVQDRWKGNAEEKAVEQSRHQSRWEPWLLQATGWSCASCHGLRHSIWPLRFTQAIARNCCSRNYCIFAEQPHRLLCSRLPCQHLKSFGILPVHICFTCSSFLPVTLWESPNRRILWEFLSPLQWLQLAKQYSFFFHSLLDRRCITLIASLTCIRGQAQVTRTSEMLPCDTRSFVLSLIIINYEYQCTFQQIS